MKVKYETAQGVNRYTVDVEADSPKALFAKIAEFAETFLPGNCGNCDSDDIVPRVREIDGNSYYSFQCQKCGASLNFGQTKAGGKLFAKRKREDGSFDSEKKGWGFYKPTNTDDGDEGEEEFRPPAKSKPPFKPNRK